MDILHCLEQEVAELKDTLQQKERELYEIKQKLLPTKSAENGKHNSENSTKVQFGDTLPKWAIERYSRQILLPDIGVRGQEKLMAARVLIVGAGGLGCPSSVYLAGAGIGEIGIVDYDQVELTNIHRQILHSEKDQNLSKAQSAANSLRSINSKIKITPYDFDLNPSNALEVAKNYDLILDCTDNVPTRYMLSDVSVLSKIPLISGSALKMEGQLTIYGYRAKNNTSEEEKSYIGPCYRCLFPTPPPPEAVGSCSANGVAGPVPGVIGALQALEAIKLIVGQTHKNLLVERMLLFDGDDTTFTTVKLRPRNPECEICSDSPKITTLLDYEVLCKSKAKGKDRNLHILPIENRISAKDLAKSLDAKESHLLVDVRSESEFNMCNIGGAVNYPLEKMNQNQFDELLEKIRECTSYVTFICRRGNDSQIAAKRVLDVLEENQRSRVKDLSGGLHAWSAHVDNEFPVY
ncbi:adenylyltransferase and sulfurtransferase MOCS3 [Maniola jurtina]|uniref:adenylyltransferase and sulfurtransferase MOCS3 n=1 Tax=Maniola jurtina TaxID=191418 RepID=UPI001E68850D|nr:adenylyltransferase and sulfurtransferase MOCS3 [Maniola jurtina]